MSEHKKSLPVLLIASLCLNGALLGVTGGMWAANTRHDGAPRPETHRMDGPRGGGMSGPFEERLARMAIESLGDQERRDFRKKLSREWKETRGNREAIDEARARILETLSADTLDEAATKDAFARFRTAEIGIREKLHTGLIGLLKDLPSEKRQEILKLSQERMSRYGEKRSGDRGERRDIREDRPFGNRPPPPPDGSPPPE